MRRSVAKRSVVLSGHKTSLSLEDAFWEGLKDIARQRQTTLANLIGGIDEAHKVVRAQVLSRAIKFAASERATSRAHASW
jgi:predicted DNA-binding ribbon-helix-helix protein